MIDFCKSGVIVKCLWARVAQWIEQKFPKLLVGGSVPLPGTSYFSSPGEKKSNQKKSHVTSPSVVGRGFFIGVASKKSHVTSPSVVGRGFFRGSVLVFIEIVQCCRQF